MNERIEKLIVQAGIESYPAKLLVNADENGEISSKWEIPLERFAELLIKECASEAHRRVCIDGNDNMIYANLLAHFGIE